MQSLKIKEKRRKNEKEKELATIGFELPDYKNIDLHRALALAAILTLVTTGFFRGSTYTKRIDTYGI